MKINLTCMLIYQHDTIYLYNLIYIYIYIQFSTHIYIYIYSFQRTYIYMYTVFNAVAQPPAIVT